MRSKNVNKITCIISSCPNNNITEQVLKELIAYKLDLEYY